jgi:hypothetical protein
MSLTEMTLHTNTITKLSGFTTAKNNDRMGKEKGATSICTGAWAYIPPVHEKFAVPHACYGTVDKIPNEPLKEDSFGDDIGVNKDLLLYGT